MNSKQFVCLQTNYCISNAHLSLLTFQEEEQEDDEADQTDCVTSLVIVQLAKRKVIEILTIEFVDATSV